MQNVKKDSNKRTRECQVLVFQDQTTKFTDPSALPIHLEDKNKPYLAVTCSLGRLKSEVTFHGYGSARF